MRLLNTFFLLSLLFFCQVTKTKACDTTPVLTATNVLDNGDGTYYMDITACIGSGGSADGFDLYFNNNMNIIATTVTEIEAPITSGNMANVSVNNGIWLAYFEQYDIDGTYFENQIIVPHCIIHTIPHMITILCVIGMRY